MGYRDSSFSADLVSPRQKDPTFMTDTTTAFDSTKTRHRRAVGRTLIAIWVVLIALVITLTVTSRATTEDHNNLTTRYLSNTAHGADYIGITARVIDVDPASDHLQARLTLKPFGRYANANGTLAVPIKLDVDGVPGGQETFEAGHTPIPVLSTISLIGELSQYPFDSYNSLLVVEVSQVGTPGLVPIKLSITGGQRDWSITPSRVAKHEGNSLATTVAIERGGATIGFALFELFLMFVLAAIAVAITYSTVIIGRPLEFSYFTWLGALIFALPAVRASLPGNPPIGTLGTIIFFFPALATVTVCMLVAAITFVHRARTKS